MIANNTYSHVFKIDFYVVNYTLHYRDDSVNKTWPDEMNKNITARVFISNAILCVDKSKNNFRFIKF